MADYRIRLLPETLRSRDSATFTGSYQTLGSVLTNPARLLHWINDSDQDVFISWDGTNDHSYIPANSFLLLDCGSNRAADNVLAAGAGTQFYIKGSAGTGVVYFSVYYAT
jgi:hypothetical protein